ncbi:putative transmembrane protein [Cryptosporidium felis]|nr:putative transmembrane protein [Cryptosporidium felis]
MTREEQHEIEVVGGEPNGTLVESSVRGMEVSEREREKEVPNYVVFLRELFVGMIGVQGVYIFVNFIFKNYPGSLLSMLLTITAIYTHFDRRFATYSLNIGVELLLGMAIGFSIYSPVQGFEKYFDDPDLKRITLPQLVYCGIFALISTLLARFEKRHHQNTKNLKKR